MSEKEISVKSWHDKHYAFFSHRECEAFPCHPIDDTDNFNCLFCYCPLYTLGGECGGSPEFFQDGLKNCTNCELPHERDNYGVIIAKLQDVMRKMKKNED